MISGNKDYKLPALLANGTQGPYPRAVFDVALPYGDYYLTQAVIRLAESVPSGGLLPQPFKILFFCACFLQFLLKIRDETTVIAPASI
jgi:hypothetical protein